MGSAYEFYRNQSRFISSFQRHIGRFFYPKTPLLSVKRKTEVQERKVPDWAVNCGPNLLEGIRSALSFSDGQQFVHLQPVCWVHWCMYVHVTTSYSMYPTPDIFWGPPLHGTWAAAGREGSNQDREGFVWRPGMEKCTEAIWGWKGRLGPDRFWDFGIERDYEYFRSLFPISPNYLLFLGIVHIYRSGIIFKLQIKHLQANSCLRLDEPKQKGILVIQNELRFGELCSRVAGHLVLVRSLCLQSGWRGLGLYEAFGVPCGTQQTSNAKRLAVIHSSVMWWCYQWFVLCFQLFWWSVSIHESLLDTKSELA